MRHAVHAVSTHSRPKAAGQPNCAHQTVLFTFQLTAARRRLDGIAFFDTRYRLVSTHSRPKAAGMGKAKLLGLVIEFQLTAARRRLG